MLFFWKQYYQGQMVHCGSSRRRRCSTSLPKRKITIILWKLATYYYCAANRFTNVESWESFSRLYFIVEIGILDIVALIEDSLEGRGQH